ncbi:MAG TPA: methyltransferase domain-containing protein [Ktedonobacterales bacterium]
MTDLVVLSHFQARPLLTARAAGASRAAVSLDLGLTTAEVELTGEGIVLPVAGGVLAWAEVERIANAENACFTVEHGVARAIQVFSETTNWLRSLMPTAGAPTMLVSGIAMHRIKHTEPHRDTLAKIAALAPIIGRVLDTATGLGYTAIEAARKAEAVVTIELDPAALAVARRNPWSRALFDNPRIQQIVGDASEVVAGFADQSFDRILHDPPVFGLAGDLYSGAFYAQLARILRRKGRLFHYIGDPESATGRRTTAGVIRRLGEAGFARVVRHPEAFGVTAFK